MGSKSPDPPAAPDYAAANREGIISDIETLPLRRQIEQASVLGTGAVFNGKYYANAADAYAAAERQKAELDAKIADYENRMNSNFGWAYAGGAQQLSDLREQRARMGEVGDFTGLGDDTLSRKYLGIALDGADELARRQLAAREELGVRNVQQTVAELKAADPEGYAARERIQRALEQDVEGFDPNAGDLGKLLGDARADYALGNKLDEGTRREVEQAARAAQAARGNILGIAPAVQEAMEIGSAGEARKQQRAAALSALESASYGRKQQNLSNASSFLLGNPITNQFGNLAGAQSGALNYQPQAATKGIGQNANAGQQAAGFAQQNYSQAMNAWQQQQSQGDPWMNIASGVIGAGVGAFTGGLGAGLAGGALNALGTSKR